MARRPLVLIMTLTGCPQVNASSSSAPEPLETVDEASVDSLIPGQPANRGAGEILELTVPILGGEALELASLRGRPVVVEISASWEEGWTETHMLESELVETHPDLAVFVVSAEPDDRSLQSLPAGLAPVWDPAGALAAKLSIAILPTLFVLDRRGRIVAVLSGWDEETLPALAQAVDLAMAFETEDPSK